MANTISVDASAPVAPLAIQPRYRLYRAPCDSRRVRFDCGVDTQIPVIAGVAIAVRDQADVDAVLHLVEMAGGLVAVVRVDDQRRKHLVIQDRTPRATRTIDACSLCCAQVEPDDDGPCCQDATIVQVELARDLALRPASWTQADEDRWQARLADERARIASRGLRRAS